MGALIHLSHMAHALEDNSDGPEFKCNGCNKKGNKRRYECAGCRFHLHHRCAKAPKILKKCLKHKIDGHHMELKYINYPGSSSSSSASTLNCASCHAQIDSGLFYSCKVCSFTLHMLCSHNGPQVTAPQTSGGKGGSTTGKKIATGLLVGSCLLAAKSAVLIATGGTIFPFDGSELSHFSPILPDFGGGLENLVSTDDAQVLAGCFEDEEMDFDFGEEDEDDWEFTWD